MSVKKRVNVLEHYKLSVDCFLKKEGLVSTPDSITVLRQVPKKVNFAAYSPLLKLYIIRTDDYFYESYTGGEFKSVFERGTDPPFLVEDCDEGIPRTILFSGNRIAVYTEGKRSILQLPMRLTCGAVHRGRIFGADGADSFILRWSGLEGYGDWTETLHGGGHVRLDTDRGRIINVVEYGEKLVLVRQYGLTVFNACGSPENFRVELTDTDSDLIAKNSVQVIGGKMYFFSKSGLKYFDGVKITPVKIRHETDKFACSAQFNGKYYFISSFPEFDGNVIVCVDTADNESAIINTEADRLLVTDRGIYFYYMDTLNEFTGTKHYRFYSKPIDFGTAGYKTVTKVEVRGGARVFISCDDDKKTAEAYCYDGEFRTHMRGKKFSVVIDGDGDVNAVYLTAEVMNAV